MTDRQLTDVFYVHNGYFMPTSVRCGRANSSSKVDDERKARLPRCWLRRHCAHRAGDAQPGPPCQYEGHLEKLALLSAVTESPEL